MKMSPYIFDYRVRKTEWHRTNDQELLESHIKNIISDFPVLEGDDDSVFDHTSGFIRFYTKSYMATSAMQLQVLKNILKKHPEWLEYFI